MQPLGYVLWGFVLMLIRSAISSTVPGSEWLPHVALPLVILLSSEVELSLPISGAAVFVLGWIEDSFAGNGIGLRTFGLVSTFLVIRLGGVRFASGPPFFESSFVFVFELWCSGILVLFRAIFDRQSRASIAVSNDNVLTGWLGAFNGNGVSLAKQVLISALVTALVAPVVFWGARQVAQMTLKRGRER